MPSYILASVDAGKWVSEVDHEWKVGCSTERKFLGLLPQPSFWRQHYNQVGRGAFHNWIVYWPLDGPITSEFVLLVQPTGISMSMHAFKCALILGDALFVKEFSPNVTHVLSPPSCPGLVRGQHRCYSHQIVCDFLVLVCFVCFYYLDLQSWTYFQYSFVCSTKVCSPSSYDKHVIGAIGTFHFSCSSF